MEMRHLRHLAAVIEVGNISRAAEVLNITQPALTRSIKTLEDLVGGALIERRPRGVVATREGEALYRSAKVILEEAKRAREELTQLRSGRRKSISVGIAAMFADQFMDSVAVAYCRKRPGLRMTITEGLYEELVADLAERRLDVLFCNLPGVPLPDNLQAEPMLEVHSILVARSDHNLAQKLQVTRQDLAGARWAVVNQAHMREIMDHFFAAEGVKAPHATIQTNSIPLIRSMVTQDDFVSILPHHLVRTQLRRGTLKRIQTPGAELIRHAGIIARLDARQDQDIAAFIDTAREMVSAAADI